MSAGKKIILFDVSYVPKKTITKKSLIAEDVNGVIGISPIGKYYVISNGEKFAIHKKSYDTKGHIIVYCRFLDKFNHRIKIIRQYSNRIRLDSRFYTPFTCDSIVRGDIVINTYGDKEFRIRHINTEFYNLYESTFENFVCFNNLLKEKRYKLADDEIKIF